MAGRSCAASRPVGYRGGPRPPSRDGAKRSGPPAVLPRLPSISMVSGPLPAGPVPTEDGVKQGLPKMPGLPALARAARETTITIEPPSDGLASASPKATGQNSVRCASTSPILRKATRSRSEIKLCKRVFDLADRGAQGFIDFRDFAWLHRKVLKNYPNAGRCTRDPFSRAFPQQLFRTFDADGSATLDWNEWAEYAQGVMASFGKRGLSETCHELAQEQEHERYSLQASWALLDKVTCVQHLGDEHVSVVQGFLEKRADPNFTDLECNNCDSVLLRMASKCSPAVVVEMLALGALATKPNALLDSAVLAAARARQLEVLRLLLFGRDSQGTATDKAEGLTVARLSTELVERMAGLSAREVRDLANRGADVNFRNAQGWTPISAAAYWGKTECVEMLLRLSTLLPRCSVKPNIANARGRTALHIAVQKGNTRLIPMLLDGRADVNARDVDGWTPLHYAVFNGWSDAVVALIQVGGADVTVCDNVGLSPFMTRQETKEGLSQRATDLLKPSAGVNFARAILPILNAQEGSIYDRLLALLELPGVQGKVENLRLGDQMFHPRRGPNRIQLSKLWELLGREMIQRLRSEKTDLEVGETEDVRSCQTSEDESALLEQRKVRLDVQRQFVAAWLAETKGPPHSADWAWDNRDAYREALDACIAEELAGFKSRCALIYADLSKQPGGRDLLSLPASESLCEHTACQLNVHQALPWLEGAEVDAVGAFGALRQVKALGDCGDVSEAEAVDRFMDLVTMKGDFTSGPSFWRNVYLLWLAHYARLLNVAFQTTLRQFAKLFTEEHEHEGLWATFRDRAPMSYEELREAESQRLDIGGLVPPLEPGHRSSERLRAIAGSMLDVVGCSMVASCPAAAVALVERFKQAGKGRWSKLDLVRIQSGFHPSMEPADAGGVRHICLNVVFRGGEREARAGWNGNASIVGEVNILLPQFVAVQESIQPLRAYLQKEFKPKTYES